MGVCSFIIGEGRGWSSIFGSRRGGAGVCLLLLRLGVTGIHCSSSLLSGGSAGSVQRSLPWSLSSLGGTAGTAHRTPSLSSLSLGIGAGSAQRSSEELRSACGGGDVVASGRGP